MLFPNGILRKGLITRRSHDPSMHLTSRSHTGKRQGQCRFWTRRLAQNKPYQGTEHPGISQQSAYCSKILGLPPRVQFWRAGSEQQSSGKLAAAKLISARRIALARGTAVPRTAAQPQNPTARTLSAKVQHAHDALRKRQLEVNYSPTCCS